MLTSEMPTEDSKTDAMGAEGEAGTDVGTNGGSDVKTEAATDGPANASRGESTPAPPERPEGPEGPETPDLAASWGGREIRRAIIALILMVPVPAISVGLAMTVPGIKGEPLGKVFYFAAKIWTCLLPVTWLLLMDRGRLSLSPSRQGGLVVGGVAICAVIMAAYWIYSSIWTIPDTIRTEAIANGIGTPLKYILFVCGLSLTNSLMEEYVWRWFVFRKCEALVGSVGAVFLGAGLFTLHHTVALRAQTDWSMTLLGSAGCFIGGALWSWLYLRYRSIWPGYIAHVFADAAIYIIGWWLIFGQG